MRPRNLALRGSLLLCLALPMVGCHSQTGPVTADDVERVPERPLATLVDPASVGALRIDLARLEDSSTFTLISEWAEALTEESQQSDAITTRLVLRSRELLMFVVDGEAPRPVLLVRGRYSTDDVLALLRETESTERRQGPFVVRDAGLDGAVALLGNHTLVLGERGAVDRVIERQLSGGGSMPTSARFRETADAIAFDTSPFAFAIVPSDRMRRAAADDPVSEALGQAQAVGLGLDLRSGIQGQALVRLDSTIAAMALTTLARAQVGALASAPEMVESGLALLVPHLEFDREGSSVTARLDAPESVVRQVLDRAGAFLRSARVPPGM